MIVEAVVFDWGRTLSANAEVDMLDMWQAAARGLAPDRPDEPLERLVELGLDVTDAVLAEAVRSQLDAWTEHIHHDPDAAPTLTALREFVDGWRPAPTRA
jgi:hypothetical protein